MHFQKLPEDLLEIIFCNLPLIDITRFRLVCKHWNYILASLQSRHYSILAENEWVALIDDEKVSNRRFLDVYAPSLDGFYKLDFSFLPPQFTVPVAASGGLLCVATPVSVLETSTEGSGSETTNILCICNPLTKKFRILPSFRDLICSPVTFMIEDPESESHMFLIIAEGIQARYLPCNGRWIRKGCELDRPRSPVMASDGVIYGIEDVGTVWHPIFRLSMFDMYDVCAGFWVPVRGNGWSGEITDILKEPRLARGREGCLLLAAGLRSSPSLDSACETFVILELHLDTLDWYEAAKMPMEFFQHFDARGDFNIFGGIDGVYFSSKSLGPERLVFWDFSGGVTECWSWLNIPFEGRNVISRAIPFEFFLNAVP